MGKYKTISWKHRFSLNRFFSAKEDDGAPRRPKGSTVERKLTEPIPPAPQQYGSGPEAQTSRQAVQGPLPATGDIPWSFSRAPPKVGPRRLGAAGPVVHNTGINRVRATCHAHGRNAIHRTARRQVVRRCSLAGQEPVAVHPKRKATLAKTRRGKALSPQVWCGRSGH